MSRRFVVPRGAAVAAIVLVGCPSGAGGAIVAPAVPPAPPSPTVTAVTDDGEPALEGELVVFAAASLQDTFPAIGDLLEAEHPDLAVIFSFGSSGTLAAQLAEGAPADVFAAASATTMQGVGAGASTVFARNSLVIAVPAGNPAGVTGPADFADGALTIALCDPSAPCGSAAQRALAAAGVTAAPDTFGQDARATLRLVTAGEVDAALVYRTDALAAGDAVATLPFPEAVTSDYPIAALAGAPHPAAAQAFVELVLSPQGQRILADAGFGSA